MNLFFLHVNSKLVFHTTSLAVHYVISQSCMCACKKTSMTKSISGIGQLLQLSVNVRTIEMM